MTTTHTTPLATGSPISTTDSVFHAYRVGEVQARSVRITLLRPGVAEPLELPATQGEHAAASVSRPSRRDGGARARLEATAEGRALLGRARQELGSMLAADNLVPLAALRMQQGLSQQQLAQISGIQQPQLSRIESGQHDIKVSTAERLAQALGVPTADVIEAVLATRGEQPAAGHE